MAIKTEPKRVGDLVLNEWDQRATRIQAQFDNDTGGAKAFVIGQSLEFDTDHYQPADSTAGDGVLLENIASIANGASVSNVAILVRGPVIINKSELVHDSGGTVASIEAALLAKGIVQHVEPTNTTEG